jgi:hypothetical protein
MTGYFATWRFITFFTTASRWFLSRVRGTSPTPSHLISVRFILISFSPVYAYLPSILPPPPQAFPPKLRTHLPPMCTTKSTDYDAALLNFYWKQLLSVTYANGSENICGQGRTCSRVQATFALVFAGIHRILHIGEVAIWMWARQLRIATHCRSHGNRYIITGALGCPKTTTDGHCSSVLIVSHLLHFMVQPISPVPTSFFPSFLDHNVKSVSLLFLLLASLTYSSVLKMRYYIPTEPSVNS